MNLTARQREVVSLLTRGHKVAAAARTLHISPKTIEDHRLAIYIKLGLNNVVDLTHWAIANKVVHIKFQKTLQH